MTHQTLRERLQLLDDRQFRLVFSAHSLSTLGDAVSAIALAFAVLDIGGSATSLGVVLAARYVPLAGFLLVGGVVADRLPRLRVMISSDVARACTQGILAVLLVTGVARVWQLVILQVVYGVAAAFFTPCLTGLVPELVEPARLRKANSLLGTMFSFSLFVGPALGGLIVVSMGTSSAIIVDAATFVVSALLLAQLRLARTIPETPQPIQLVADIKEGWSEIRTRRWLLLTIGNGTLFNALAVPAIVVLGPELARSELGGVGAWSILVAAFGAGSLVGSIASIRFRIVRPGAATAVLLAIAGSEPAALASGLGVPLIAALCFVAGAALAMAIITWISMVQQHVAPSRLARVDSMDDFATLLLTPLGYLLVGPLANKFGVDTTLELMSAGTLLACLLTLASREVRELRWVTSSR